ncbi:MAG TPA: hypothetical protein VH639_20575 [Bryobacteraceae bacterium]|jgi:hypothetical protein
MRWFLLAASGIVGYQILLPPVVGLADQGDFRRVIGKFGYGPAAPENLYGSISLKYAPDPTYNLKGWEQPSTEDLFVELALWINRLVSKDGKFDIRVMGVLNSAAFLAALAWLFRVTRDLPARPLIWAGTILATTDVGYVAYFSSFYAEPCSYLFCLLLIADSIDICRRGISTARLIRWSIWAGLFVMAKPVNAPIGVILGFFVLRLSWRSWAGWLGSAAIWSAVFASIVTVPAEMTQANAYNLVFQALLRESSSPQADVVALGLKPGTDVYTGTGAWSRISGYDRLRRSGEIPNKVNLLSVDRFFVTHPTRLWRHIRANLSIATLLRPNLGNFDSSLPNTQSKAFALWSGFHETVLRRIARLLFFLLPVPPIALAWMWLCRRRSSISFRFLALQSTCCLVAFLTASFGDGWETLKHMFVFNVLIDSCLFSATAAVWLAVARIIKGAPRKAMLSRSASAATAIPPS